MNYISKVNVNNTEYNIKDNVSRNTISRMTKPNMLKLVAHRGASAEAPENTLPAYEIAGQQKFWGGECDIAMTRDEHFVLMHDDTVDRTTDGEGLVSSFTLAEIKELNIDTGVNIGEYPNLKVPTLEEYLKCCKIVNLIPVIELKYTIPVEKVKSIYNIIKQFGFEDKCVVISFSIPLLLALRELSSTIHIQALLEFSQTYDGLSAIDFCALHNFDLDVSTSSINANSVAEAHSKGIEVNVWTPSFAQIISVINSNFDYATINHITDGFFNNSTNSQIEPYTKYNDISLYCEYEKDELQYGDRYFAGELGGLITRIRNGLVSKYPGNYYPSYPRMISTTKVRVKNGSVISYSLPATSNMSMSFCGYNSDDAYLFDSGWLTGTGSYTVNATTAKYVIVMFKYGSDLYFTEVQRKIMRKAITDVTY